MRNQHIESRLLGIQTMLHGVDHGGDSMSSATKGTERQAFIDGFLHNVLPATYRFGTGDATDSAGRKSGQLDVVVEYSFMPSLPLPYGVARLYLAEGVAAVIEIKSDVAKQWDEVILCARQLAALHRDIQTSITVSAQGQPGGPRDRIPLFAVGYRGWEKLETVERRLFESKGLLDGILVINPGLFVSSPEFNSIRFGDAWALWGLICCLHKSTSTLLEAYADPYAYATS
jgi:hypothetical protein